MPTNRAYTKRNRVNRGTASDAGNIQSYQSNPYSGGQKNLSVGPEFLKQVGDVFISGRDVSGAGESIQPGAIIWIYNNSATVAWLALSTAAIAVAPTGFTNGIPLTPNAWTQLSAGENNSVRASAATVGLFEVKDDSSPSEA